MLEAVWPLPMGNGFNKLGLTLWLIGLWLWLVNGISSANTPPTAATFYNPNQVQVIDLQIDDHQLKKMQSALPQRIYVPATFRWGDQTVENVGVRYKGTVRLIRTNPTNVVF